MFAWLRSERMGRARAHGAHRAHGSFWRCSLEVQYGTWGGTDLFERPVMFFLYLGFKMRTVRFTKGRVAFRPAGSLVGRG